MEDLARIIGNNLGSLSKIQICPVEKITSIPDPVNGVISSAVVFAAAGKWYDLFSSFESLQFKQKSVTTNQGKHYELNIDGFIPGHCQAMDYLLSTMEQSKFVVKATDLNGNVLLICNLRFQEIRGMTFTADYDSTSKYSGNKGYAINFSMLSCYRAYSYLFTGSGSGS